MAVPPGASAVEFVAFVEFVEFVEFIEFVEFVEFEPEDPCAVLVYEGWGKKATRIAAASSRRPARECRAPLSIFLICLTRCIRHVDLRLPLSHPSACKYVTGAGYPYIP